jgi:transposase
MQVIDLPPIEPIVTEYHWHQLLCSACGEVTRAPWPAGVPSGTYGPRGQAPVALCTGAYRLSKRATQQMMHDVFDLPLSVGTISQLEHATTAALAAPVEEARAYVQTQEVAHLDETSWRQGDQPAWLWVAVTTWVTVFVVRLSRGGHVARELLGKTFAGILVTDRYSAYNWYPVRWRQLCWERLLRDFLNQCADVGAAQRPLGMLCWCRRTRCLRGGIECARAPCNARHFVLI